MKDKISKLVFVLATLVFFIANMTLPSLKVNALHDFKEPDFEHCYWQEYSGSNYDYFCGYEVHDLHCTCGDFC